MIDLLCEMHNIFVNHNKINSIEKLTFEANESVWINVCDLVSIQFQRVELTKVDKDSSRYVAQVVVGKSKRVEAPKPCGQFSIHLNSNNNNKLSGL